MGIRSRCRGWVADPIVACMNKKTTRTALLVAVLALLIGFAGSATAAVVVTGKQIKDNTVTSSDIKNGSLESVDVKDESLTQADFFDTVAGPAGPKGDQGPPGTNGTSGLVYIVEGVDVAKRSTRIVTATCPPGTHVVSGGGSNTGRGHLVETAPTNAFGEAWRVIYRNTTDTAVSAFAWALCVTVS